MSASEQDQAKADPGKMISPDPSEITGSSPSINAPSEFAPSQQLLVSEYEEFHAGPLPSARDLAEYGQIDPGFPDRIMTMAEETLAHRRKLDHRLANLRSAGLWLGWSTTMFLMGLGGFLLWHQVDVAGWALLLAGIASIVVPMILGKPHKAE